MLSDFLTTERPASSREVCLLEASSTEVCLLEASPTAASSTEVCLLAAFSTAASSREASLSAAFSAITDFSSIVVSFSEAFCPAIFPSALFFCKH